MSPSVEIHLTEQDKNLVNYLTGKDEVSWEELAQFAKSPTTVKRKSLLRAVSDLRKKYADAGLAAPFNCRFFDLGTMPSANAPSQPVKAVAVVVAPPVVQMRKTIGGKLVRADDTKPDLHHDFQLSKGANCDGSPNYQIKTKAGWVRLPESAYELLEIFYASPGVAFSKEDLKNKLWPQWGSRTPPSWAGNLTHRMTDLRTCVPEMKTRLLTIRVNNDTSYMMK